MKAMQIFIVLCLIIGFNHASVRIRRGYGAYGSEIASGHGDIKLSSVIKSETFHHGAISVFNNSAHSIGLGVTRSESSKYKASVGGNSEISGYEVRSTHINNTASMFSGNQSKFNIFESNGSIAVSNLNYNDNNRDSARVNANGFVFGGNYGSNIKANDPNNEGPRTYWPLANEKTTLSRHVSETGDISKGHLVSGSIVRGSITANSGEIGIGNIEYRGSNIAAVSMKNRTDGQRQFTSSETKSGAISEGSVLFVFQDGNMKSSISATKEKEGIVFSGHHTNGEYQYVNTSNQGGSEAIKLNSLAIRGSSERNTVEGLHLNFKINANNSSYINLKTGQISGERHSSGSSDANGSKFNNNGFDKSDGTHLITVGSDSTISTKTNSPVSNLNHTAVTESVRGKFSHLNNKEGHNSHWSGSESLGSHQVEIHEHPEDYIGNKNINSANSEDNRSYWVSNGGRRTHETGSTGHGINVGERESHGSQWINSRENGNAWRDIGNRGQYHGRKASENYRRDNKAYSNTSFSDKNINKNYQNNLGDREHISGYDGRDGHESEWVGNGDHIKNVKPTETHDIYSEGREVHASPWRIRGRNENHSGNSHGSQMLGHVSGGYGIHLESSDGRRGSSSSSGSQGDNEGHGIDWGYSSHKSGVSDNHIGNHHNNGNGHVTFGNIGGNRDSDSFKDKEHGSYSQTVNVGAGNQQQASHWRNNVRQNSQSNNHGSPLTTNEEYSSHSDISDFPERPFGKADNNENYSVKNDGYGFQYNKNVGHGNQWRGNESHGDISHGREGHGDEEFRGINRERANHKHNVTGSDIASYNKNNNEHSYIANSDGHGRNDYSNNFKSNNNAMNRANENNFSSHGNKVSLHSSNEGHENLWRNSNGHSDNYDDSRNHESQANGDTGYESYFDHEGHGSHRSIVKSQQNILKNNENNSNRGYNEGTKRQLDKSEGHESQSVAKVNQERYLQGNEGHGDNSNPIFSKSHGNTEGYKNDRIHKSDIVISNIDSQGNSHIAHSDIAGHKNNNNKNNQTFNRGGSHINGQYLGKNYHSVHTNNNNKGTHWRANEENSNNWDVIEVNRGQSSNSKNRSGYRIDTKDQKDNKSDRQAYESYSGSPEGYGSTSSSIGVVQARLGSISKEYTRHSNGESNGSQSISSAYHRSVLANSEGHRGLWVDNERNRSHWGNIARYGNNSDGSKGHQKWSSTEGHSRFLGGSESHGSSWSGSVGYASHWDVSGGQETHSLGNVGYVRYWGINRGHESHSYGNKDHSTLSTTNADQGSL